MKHVDVVNLTQEAVAQTMGAEYMEKLGDLNFLDSYKLADVGRDVTASGTVDVYSKKLVGLMGKMVIDEKRYEGSVIKSIFVDSFDWGSFVERVYYTPQDLIEDDMWNLIAGKVYENDHKFFAPHVEAKIFEEAKSINTPCSITDEQLKTAFTGWEQMNKFLSGLHTNIENTIEMALQAYSHMIVQCGIAVSDKATGTAVHLITEAIGEGILTEGATWATARHDEDFIIYCMERIKTIRDNMKINCSVYNDKSMPTFTNDEDNKLLVLSQFDNAMKFVARRNTFNLGEIGIGEYETTPMWQGIAYEGYNDFDWSVVSTVEISVDPTNKLGIGNTVEAYDAHNCAALIFDHRALGLCPYRRKVTSSYTASADFWNEFHHLLVNYILDSKFNMVAVFMD